MKWLLTLYLQRQTECHHYAQIDACAGLGCWLSLNSESALIFQLRTLARIHDLGRIDRGLV